MHKFEIGLLKDCYCELTGPFASEFSIINAMSQYHDEELSVASSLIKNQTHRGAPTEELKSCNLTQEVMNELYDLQDNFFHLSSLIKETITNNQEFSGQIILTPIF